MPYSNQTAGKGGHSDFVRNPDVQNFLQNCEYLKPPSDEEAESMASSFMPAPSGDPSRLPRFVVASDASKSDTPVNDKLPSTQLGFIKVSHVLIVMDKYAELIAPGSRFVDPFKVADMHRNAKPITFVMPGSNVCYKGAANVRDGFRHAVYDQLTANRRDEANKMVLTETLFALNDGKIRIKTCPSHSCESLVEDFVFTPQQQTHTCKACGSIIYATDALRLHEGISDFGNNTSAMTRMMNAVEHLLLVAFITELIEADPASLGKVAFVMDGPLALFGEPAKWQPRIMKLIYRANQKLQSLGFDPLLIMGLQKTGIVMDHARLLEKFLPPGVIRVIDDEYRHKYITGSDKATEDFGYESYYGQDFLFKTERGRIFNFALPYPFEVKSGLGGRTAFSKAKVELSNYGSLIERACDLIRHFELDLYDNAIVPVALAHRHASISLVPGGKVLDLIAKAGISHR
ncbi:hypothetical protein [Spirosoma radiotolerans]|uniref:NurA domain-containing protein n=1 Tax=Spirosoma radiotolerans TaxID=1379870 RepID=A0A0E3V9Y7_9BACT|nr:hypothetical protein [Spirosoma radiotolerans]AKD57606.1 hypothetical protein SD10_24605 [Spirosoma radiotolerans]